MFIVGNESLIQNQDSAD